MTTVVTVLAFVTIAHALVSRIDAGLFERATYALLLGACFWLGSVWLLALLHILTRPLLIARTMIAIAGAIVAWRRAPVRARTPANKQVWIFAAPFAVWIAFVLVRAVIVPPVSHDALAYHLPKAVLYSRAHGFEVFPFLVAQIRGLPANYEMLLADVLTVEGSDTISEWVSAFFYVAFVVASIAVAERWWNRSRVVMGLAAASLPVALLHAGAHKNDLMTAGFTIGAVVAAGRFFTTRELPVLLIAIACFAAGTGTKPQPAIVAIALAPFIVARLRGVRAYALAIAVSFAAFAFLGGAAYVANLMQSHASGATGAAIGTSIPYGDWSNLWQAPYVLVAAPFSSDQFALHVPWANAPWFWRRYELYFSHLGIPFAVCLALLPVGLIAYARRATAEALAMTAGCAAALIAILPSGSYPHGMFTISLPRYMLFFVPVVFAWTVVPLQKAEGAIIAILVAFFAYYAVDFTINDRFEPWDYVVWAAKHPGTRVVPFDPYRAACVVDRDAGPRDTVAIDAAYGSWLYPAFGADLARKIEFVGNGSVPADAQWVIVDRGYQSVWDNPEFRDLSQARRFLTRGIPSAAGLRTVQQLSNDRRFVRVYYNAKANQAVFRRIG